ncbi:MAG TPA: hypothetical protein PK095_10805 [Myxococcota bacterium]|nr:hypothetical protein [Myxococcota bacterium]
MNRERNHLAAVLVALGLGACRSEPKPPIATLTLGMPYAEFEREFPGLKTSRIGDGWDGPVASITIKDHGGEQVLFREAASEVSVGFYYDDATTHIRPLARRPLREVIAYLEKDIPALLSKAGWKEVHSLADHWYSVYEYKCGPGDRYKFVRWEMEVSGSIAPDQIEFGIMCESLDLDSPAGAFITIRSGGGSRETSPER